MKIMIVEDDAVIALSLANELRTWGYEVALCENFSDVTEQFVAETPSLLLLDLVLPHHNGYYWCEEIRKISHVPIIFISSRSEPLDQVLAIQYGADDYLTKPLDLGLTLAKIRALLRRTYDFTGETESLYFREVALAVREAKVTYRESFVELTNTELLIVEALFKAKGEFVSREALLESCWESQKFIDDNTLAVNITRIRKKLADIGLPDFISTKKGFGYGLEG